jgi:hypothetical protein
MQRDLVGRSAPQLAIEGEVEGGHDTDTALGARSAEK